MVSFWQNALGYVPGRPAEGGWVVLHDPKEKGQTYRFRPGTRVRHDGVGFT